MSHATSQMTNDQSQHRPLGLCEGWGFNRQVSSLVKVLETPEWIIYATPRRRITEYKSLSN